MYYWHTDETCIAVPYRAMQKETQKGFFRTFLTGDGQMIYYDYQPGRGGERRLNILKAFKSHLKADGYTVYGELPLEIITVFYCFAHTGNLDRNPLLCKRLLIVLRGGRN
ncbi:IS66 family transposase [Chitinophaga sancti]|uniref:IS66 family transposase n=1 Tax=Chitinophaga sancti TaxID=1004 RepID=UPI003742204D